MKVSDFNLKSGLISSLTPVIILVAGLVFTFLVSRHLADVSEAEDQANFISLVKQVHNNIEGRIETHTALLRAGTGLFSASDTVEMDDFKNFVDNLELPEHYPGIFSIGYSVRLTPQEKDRLVASRRAGEADFNIWPDGPRTEYHSVIYLEPGERRDPKMIGFDMFTDPIRRQAMEKARDTGLPAVSARMTSIRDMDLQGNHPGFLICAPVYRNGKSTNTETERRAALLGFVFSPFQTDDFLRDIVGPGVISKISFKIHDGSNQASENLLYPNFSGETIDTQAHQPRFMATTNLDVGGRTWTIDFESRPAFAVASGKNWVPYTFAGGIFLSLLFFAVTRSQILARGAADRAAAGLRRSEATVRKTLAERERAESAVREGEERYQELVENANDIVYTLDLDGNLTSVNRAAETITGYSRDELLKMKLTEIMTPESAVTALQMFDRKLAGERRTNYELDIRSSDGRILTLEISSKLVMKAGEAVGVQGVARDITTRRRAEQALREADQRALSEYERLLERISSLAQALGTARELITIFRALREFTVTSVPCNGLFVSLYDPVEDVRTACYGWGDGHEFDVSSLPPMPVNSSGPNSRAVRTGQVIITHDYMNAQRGHPVVIVGPDNGLRPQSSLAVPMAVMGRITGTIEIQSYERRAFSDEHVTAMLMAANLSAVAIENVRLLQRESSARAAAEESNRLKDEFLATVSHELRTPLTAILGWSRMLEAGSISDPMTSRALETIRRNAKAQAQIIDDILDVSRIITGKLYLELHPLELTPVIEAAVNVVRPTAEAKGIQIIVDLEPKPLLVTGDSSRLLQVIWNLLSNAVKFTPSGGHLSLSAAEVGTQIEITVADNGQGISREFLPFVFDRFRQADSTSTRQHGGLGLGLAIARHLVEIHGGTIKAESQGEGKGATFSVRLPSVGQAVSISKSAATRQEETQNRFASDSRLDGIHVLLVDDDPDTLDLLSEALKQQRAIVTAVGSAQAALEAIKKAKPDIVVSDIAMPGQDGYQLLERIKAMNADGSAPIPALAITAYAKHEDREAALSSGYQDYLAKPIELSELVTAVANAVQRH